MGPSFVLPMANRQRQQMIHKYMFALLYFASYCIVHASLVITHFAIDRIVRLFVYVCVWPSTHWSVYIQLWYYYTIESNWIESNWLVGRFVSFVFAILLPNTLVLNNVHVVANRRLVFRFFFLFIIIFLSFSVISLNWPLPPQIQT